jgi:hypothetical protein
VLKEHRYLVSLARLRSSFDLYSAICRVVPEAHGAGWAIAPAHAGFLIRGPSKSPRIVALTIGGRCERVEIGGTIDVEAARSLVARCVIVRLTNGLPSSHDEMRRVVDAHVQARASAIGVSVELGQPRAVRVHGRMIRGFSARATTTSDCASIELQRLGIGGKRSMGCGVFCAEGSLWS